MLVMYSEAVRSGTVLCKHPPLRKGRLSPGPGSGHPPEPSHTQRWPQAVLVLPFSWKKRSREVNLRKEVIFQFFRCFMTSLASWFLRDACPLHMLLGQPHRCCLRISHQDPRGDMCAHTAQLSSQLSPGPRVPLVPALPEEKQQR